jgi:DNA-binding GntR family transcriptional regulator
MMAERETMPDNEVVTLATRAAFVAQRLRTMIQAGELPPGSVLTQTEIAKRFGVSTTPVREAFAVLVRDGLVQQDAHRSVRVFKPSLKELAEIYEIRGVLEPFATELAAKKIKPDELRELEALVDEMRTADPVRFVELNGVLHGRIYEIADRPRLAGIIESLRKTAANYVLLTTKHFDADYHHAVQSQHEQIVAALGAGRGKEAAKVVRQHMKTSANRVSVLVAQADESATA